MALHLQRADDPTLAKPRFGEKACDVKRGAPPTEMGRTISFCLQTKGYCCIGDGLDEETQEAALREIDALEEAERFECPPTLVQDGLLGSDGSGKIHSLDM